jgi:hypothetical protein
MELFQRLLNVYKQADKKLGGFLPGGGTANPLSNTIRTINPSDAAGYLAPNLLNTAQKKVGKVFAPMVTSANETLTLKQIPALMEAASKRMTQAGFPGTWSPHVQGKEVGEVRQGRPGTKVDLSGGGFGALAGGPIFMNVNPMFGVDEPTVYVTSKTPGWAIAHELGHAVDAIKRPYDYSVPKGFDFTDEKAIKNIGTREMTRAASPGAIVTGFGSLKNDDRSLLGAGIEGALSGIGASQQMLRKEVMADRFGMPIAKEAGVPWNTRQNILAKSTYALGATVPGFSQGVVAELLGRGADALGNLTNTAIRAFQGPQLNSTEQALVQYGYDPSKYKMSKPGAEIKIKKRNNAEQALYNYIRGLK